MDVDQPHITNADRYRFGNYTLVFFERTLRFLFGLQDSLLQRGKWLERIVSLAFMYCVFQVSPISVVKSPLMNLQVLALLWAFLVNVAAQLALRIGNMIGEHNLESITRLGMSCACLSVSYLCFAARRIASNSNILCRVLHRKVIHPVLGFATC